MGKPGPKPQSTTLQPVSVRVEPTAKFLMDEYGDTEYWRSIIEAMALTKAELDQGKIPPEDFANVAGARVAQVTGIAGNHPPDDTKARKVDTSDVQGSAPWENSGDE